MVTMIKDEIITVTINSANRTHYSALGYDIPDTMRTPMQVSSLHLPKNSQFEINRICDDCGEEHRMKRVKYRAVCRKCNSARMSKERKDLSKTTCLCGNPKSYVAKGCRECVDMSGENNPMYGKKSPFMSELNRNRKPEDHWNWKGGNSKDRSGKVIEWARLVKLAANTECDLCRYTNELALDAHHLDSYERGNKENYNVDNGVCLCKNCHAVFHKTYGYGNNTKQQYKEFKENF